MLSCELGGFGRVSRRAVEAGWRGALRVLAGDGVVAEDAAVRLGMTPPGPTRFADLGAGSGFVTAVRHALAEPLVGMGELVTEGQPVARLHDPHDLTVAAQTMTAPVGGIVVIRRRGALVRPGDHLLAICPELSPADLARMIG